METQGSQVAAKNRANMEIPISLVDLPADGGIRQHYNEVSLDELAKSTSDLGAIYPIMVRDKSGGRYELIVGSRRLRVAKKLGFEKIWATVLSGVDDRRRLEIAFAENLHREDLTPFEEARVILKFINDYKMSLGDIAKRVGRSEIFVRQRLQLLSLPREIQKMVAERKISLVQASTLAALNSPEEQVRLARKTIESDLADEELTTLVREGRKARPVVLEKPKRGRPPKSTEEKAQPKPKVKPASPKKPFGFRMGKLTGERLNLKVLGFARWLEAILPEVKQMPLPDRLAVQKPIRELMEVAKNYLPKDG